MFQHKYILALNFLKQGRISLCENFSSDENRRNWNLMNRIIESNNRNSDLIRKIFFLEEAGEFLFEIRNVKSVIEFNGKERTITNDDIFIVCKGVDLYLDSELSIFATCKLNSIKRSEYESLLVADMSMDKKVARIRNNILLEKNKFEKLFKDRLKKK